VLRPPAAVATMVGHFAAVIAGIGLELRGTTNCYGKPIHQASSSHAFAWAERKTIIRSAIGAKAMCALHPSPSRQRSTTMHCAIMRIEDVRHMATGIDRISTYVELRSRKNVARAGGCP
jgi:hypothetical protein